MSIPIYHMPSVNNKVKVLVNGQKVSTHPATSKNARYLNFIGEDIPEIIENNETDSFDIDLESYIHKILDKYMEDKKTVKKTRKKKS
jgi:predicted house-cleaning noncanonical NTP pyrophosphatase (MazG superfamily)